MNVLKVKFTANSANPPESFWDTIFETSLNGPCLQDSGEHPMPWDAGFSIEPAKAKRGHKSDLVISGGAGAGGYGSCVVRVPLNDNVPYHFELEFAEEHIQFLPALRKWFDENGYQTSM